MRNVIIACITSILQVGICYSDEVPTDRPSIGDALKELQAIRDKFQYHPRLKGRCQLGVKDFLCVVSNIWAVWLKLGHEL